MEWADGIADLITAVATAVGGAVAWTVARKDKKSKETEKSALKTVTAWEKAMARKNQQLQALQGDYERAREIIIDQDQRIIRKDRRITHLEELLDNRRAQG